MICGPCKSQHTGMPDGCQYGCTCQHKGTLELKPEPPKVVGWGCRVCGWTYDLGDPGCECDTPRDEERYDIYEGEIGA